MAERHVWPGAANRCNRDDGVGIQVAKELKAKIEQHNVAVEETSMAGLNLLDLLAGYDRVIIVDAIQTTGGRAGQIYKLEPTSFYITRHAATPHDVNFATALELGSRLGLTLPKRIDIFAIEVADVSTFSEEYTPEVRQAIPVCVEKIIQELKGDHST